MAQTNVPYWYMNDSEHGLFEDYLETIGMSRDDCPFTWVAEENRWCLIQSDQTAEWNDILGDFDLDDGVVNGGAQCFGLDYWTLSTIPSVMGP